jgi:hypothetical protein
MKVGDLIKMPYIGIGIVLEIRHKGRYSQFRAYFQNKKEVSDWLWCDLDGVEKL